MARQIRFAYGQQHCAEKTIPLVSKNSDVRGDAQAKQTVGSQNLACVAPASPHDHPAQNT
jgi:hypothetical protein